VLKSRISLSPRFKETGTGYSIQKDEFNYVWVVLRDKDFDDLVTNIKMVSRILMEQGFGTQLLAAVYRFKGENTVYWIYNFKLGSYYPFVPSGNQQRNTPFEFRLMSVMGRELPIEKDEAKWYPMWGMPIENGRTRPRLSFVAVNDALGPSQLVICQLASSSGPAPACLPRADI
jgi:hypothetical protein